MKARQAQIRVARATLAHRIIRATLVVRNARATHVVRKILAIHVTPRTRATHARQRTLAPRITLAVRVIPAILAGTDTSRSLNTSAGARVAPVALIVF